MKCDKDRDEDRADADISAVLGHEKLVVYRKALEHVAWVQAVLADIESPDEVLDHWIRATESIVENIANGNSRRSMADRNRYFDVATGSALECAACLDICRRKELLTDDRVSEGKKILQPIVKMVIALRQAQSAHIREKSEPYVAGGTTNYFAHEGLDAYKMSLVLVAWLHRFLASTDVGAPYKKRLDTNTTSMVLNIAEGNGRFSKPDQIRFLDIAHTSAMRVASSLDILVARRSIHAFQVVEGKHLLSRIVPLVLGLRGYLADSGPRE